ncbi:hypothetical protein BU26DRAFT_521308 [Trematosphaeria pertusa]|uniref:Uncharacterized protein n=1 Tax=Trematosphaeria pertusa TaxID=390896 RepID=A0A6A6IA46_9PLEO|nr:uncharacterized protein BU26DRAFT_521308 [Trematosphaeria pertusa]KAF2246928.1 hypothetical protein BU26DRAFT_521308 [Trematosphaeria pertusa]
MSARSRKLRCSLGDSWGDADYYSDSGASIHSASSLSDQGDSELEDEDKRYAHEHQDVATPLPPRVTRASSREPQTTPVKTPPTRIISGHSQTPGNPRSHRSTPGSGSLEPSFIMPSMSASPNGLYNGSPLRNSQMRVRKSRQPSVQSQPGSTNPSPQVRNRRTSGIRPDHQFVQEEQEPLGPWHYVELFRTHVVWPLAQYILDVFAYAMNHFMKPLLGVAVGAFLIISIIQLSSGFLLKTFQTALTPICIIPGSSYVIPYCATTPRDVHQPDFEEVINVQSTFEEVLDASKDSYALPATMKKSEVAIRDLRSLVKYSQLPSRSQLEVEFSTFIETAREASGNLANYNSKIGYTMDKVISTNQWSLNVLEDIAEKHAGSGALSRALSYINPLSVFVVGPASLEQQIFDQYVQHVSHIKEDIQRLIEISQALMALLNSLEGQLDVIADIAARDNFIVNKNRDELLAQLWSMLGGNRSGKKSFDESLRLLKDVVQYKDEAVKHVSATLLKLQEISADLENLREGVGAPEVVGYRDEIPLRYHIDVVGKSVERLREKRGESMQVERDAIRKGLGEDMGDRGLPGKDMPTVYAKPARK